MIISRTPLRISFVGGGTDLRSFYEIEQGQVLSTSIDKYIYVVVKRQVGIVEFKYRVNWSRVEFRNSIDEIEHPIVREALRIMKIDFPLEITTFADIPAQTGLGSSSAFAVGLLNALYALKSRLASKSQLASEAARIEVELLGRTMGKQDHYAAACGNMNIFTFNPGGEVTVEPVFYSQTTRMRLEKNLLLFYTHLKRDASEVLTSQNHSVHQKRHVLQRMRDLVPELRDVLTQGTKLHRFGEVLHQGWLLKRSLTEDISNPMIDDYYRRAMEAGALGGKLLGAGGGGFLMFYVESKSQKKVISALKELYYLPVGFDTGGTRITYYDEPKIR